MAAGHREPSAGHQLAVLRGRGTMPDTAGAMVYEEAVSCHGVALALAWRPRDGPMALAGRSADGNGNMTPVRLIVTGRTRRDRMPDIARPSRDRVPTMARQ